MKGRKTIIATESRVCGMIEVTETSGLSALIRVSHTAQTIGPDTILYGVSYLHWWNGREGDGPLNNRSQELVDIGTSGGRKVRHVQLHTHQGGERQHRQTDKLRHNLSIKAQRPSLSITALAQSKKIHLIIIGSVQFCSNHIKHQKKLHSRLMGQRSTWLLERHFDIYTHTQRHTLTRRNFKNKLRYIYFL